MRIANIAQRAHIVVGAGRAVDIGRLSNGRFGPAMPDLYRQWDEFRSWAVTAPDPDESNATAFEIAQVGNPSPAPWQVFAIGLNYSEHAGETGTPLPEEPAVFTKFPTSLAGPESTVALPAGNVDWEAELVVVIGRGGRAIATDSAWEHVAGVSVGQDLSERVLQSAGPIPQFSLGKSHAGFSPVGPFLVTTDELDDPDDLALGCRLNGEQLQKSRTRHMIFPVPVLIAKLSAVVELLPGDLIFTGTPSGVGLARTPPRFIRPGDELVSYVEGVGEIRQAFTTATSHSGG
jgi:2-keto-4-pentenoate hydratase/2-oxohepta-3-ene-1,7-dioic acid hydratase in catechol pathway